MNVVARTDEQDVSDAQVKSQIAALNRDYGAKNEDRASVPTPWTGLVTDSKVRFKLVEGRAQAHDRGGLRRRRHGQAPVDGRGRARSSRRST